MNWERAEWIREADRAEMFDCRRAFLSYCC
jgi:hypothetical protein